MLPPLGAGSAARSEGIEGAAGLCFLAVPTPIPIDWSRIGGIGVELE
jgi:hypothetical protein